MSVYLGDVWIFVKRFGDFSMFMKYLKFLVFLDSMPRREYAILSDHFEEENLLGAHVSVKNDELV